jgi:hypothetical protein
MRQVESLYPVRGESTNDLFRGVNLFQRSYVLKDIVNSLGSRLQGILVLRWQRTMIDTNQPTGGKSVVQSSA